MLRIIGKPASLRSFQFRNFFWSKSPAAATNGTLPIKSNQPLETLPTEQAKELAVDIAKATIDPSLMPLEASQSELISKISQIGDLASLGFCNSYTPQGWMEMLLEASHVYSGLQWGGSIILATVILRLALLPVGIKAQRSMVKMKDFKPLMSVYQEKAKGLQAVGRLQDAKMVNQELFFEMRGKGINPFAGLWGLIQIPFFISFFLALRGMAALPVPGLKDGGFLWFTDLSVADPFYILPVLGGVSLLLAMEANKAMPMTDGGKLALRTVSILSIGALAFLPSAVLLFTITSGGLTILQTVLLQNESVKKILKMESNPELSRDKQGKLHILPEIKGNNSMLKFKPLSFSEARRAINEHLRKAAESSKSNNVKADNEELLAPKTNISTPVAELSQTQEIKPTQPPKSKKPSHPQVQKNKTKKNASSNKKHK